MLSIGNDELENLPTLGSRVNCTHCGDKHEVKYGNKILDDGTRVPDNTLAYYTCGESIYLCGVCGKDITNREEPDELAEAKREIFRMSRIIASTSREHSPVCTCPCCTEIEQHYQNAKEDRKDGRIS